MRRCELVEDSVLLGEGFEVSKADDNYSYLSMACGSRCIWPDTASAPCCLAAMLPVIVIMYSNSMKL